MKYVLLYNILTMVYAIQTILFKLIHMTTLTYTLHHVVYVNINGNLDVNIYAFFNFSIFTNLGCVY